jgi:hypothetical protein
MSVRDDALVREDKTVDSVCEEAGSCEASASSLHQFVHQSARTALWRQRLKKVFFLPFPSMIFMLFFVSVALNAYFVELVGVSYYTFWLLCYGLFLVATAGLQYHEDDLFTQLDALSLSEKKVIISLGFCSYMKAVFFFFFVFFFLALFFFLHFDEIIAHVPAVTTSSDYILLSSWIGLIVYDLILNRCFKHRSKWHKESSSCN